MPMETTSPKEQRKSLEGFVKALIQNEDPFIVTLALIMAENEFSKDSHGLVEALDILVQQGAFKGGVITEKDLTIARLCFVNIYQHSFLGKYEALDLSILIAERQPGMDYSEATLIRICYDTLMGMYQLKKESLSQMN